MLSFRFMLPGGETWNTPNVTQCRLFPLFPSDQSRVREFPLGISELAGWWVGLLVPFSLLHISYSGHELLLAGGKSRHYPN